jgi:hypothetical protein
VVFLIAAAILDKLYLAPDIQIPLIVGLIVATFAMIILSIPVVIYQARGDNGFEGHVPQLEEPLDLFFHGGRVVETPLNYEPDTATEEGKKDYDDIESGKLVPRHDIPLYLTEEKDLGAIFSELINLGIETVTKVHLRFHRHFSERFDLSTGAVMVKSGIPLYHPHSEEVYLIPVGVDYYDGVPNPVFEVMFSRKGDYEMLSNPVVMDTAFAVWVAIQKGVEQDKVVRLIGEALENARAEARARAGP